MDWGPTGAEAIATDCDVAVIVDVLSFTTTLTVAADRNVVVYPYRWRDDRATSFAAEHKATLAVGRSHAVAGQVSLSPHSVRTAPALERLVLPSPNGSTISFQMATTASVVIGVSLRNRRAAAHWLLTRRELHPMLRVAVIAAGERWPDGSLRPAVEDHWGAGSLIDLLYTAGWASLSPEAQGAAAAYRSVADDISTALEACGSGRELIELGYPDDVLTAAQLDSSSAVPLLQGGGFIRA